MSIAKKLTYAKKELQKTNKKEETTMITKFAKLLSPSRRKEEGFTLIELLIVVAIIAILAAIAIPQFSAYRQRGIRASMVADGRNTATMLETMFTDCNSYVWALAATGTGPGAVALAQGAASTTTCPGNPTNASTYPVNISNANTLTVTVATAAAWTLTIGNTAANGSGFTSPLSRTSAGACTWATGGNC